MGEYLKVVLKRFEQCDRVEEYGAQRPEGGEEAQLPPCDDCKRAASSAPLFKDVDDEKVSMKRTAAVAESADRFTKKI